MNFTKNIILKTHIFITELSYEFYKKHYIKNSYIYYWTVLWILQKTY